MQMRPTAIRTRDGIEREHAAQAGGDALAAAKSEIDRESCGRGSRRARSGRASRRGCDPVNRLKSPGKPKVGKKPLEQVEQQDQKKVAKAERSTDVGRTQVARADGADVDALPGVGDQVAEGDRPGQVGGRGPRAPRGRTS